MQQEPTFSPEDAFSFIKEKTGRIPPKKYVLKKLKQGQIQDLSIPEDLGDDPELILMYKILYAQEDLTPQELQQESLDLDLSHCNLQSLPNGLRIRKLNIRDTPIKNLPSDIYIRWELIARDCTSIKEIPLSLSSKMLVLDLDGCTSLKKIPKGFRARVMILKNCISLKTLPDGLKVKTLCCTGCTSLKGLPRWVDIGGTFSADDKVSFFSKKFKNIDEFMMADAIRHYIEKDLKGKVRNVYYDSYIDPAIGDIVTSKSISKEPSSIEQKRQQRLLSLSSASITVDPDWQW